MTFFSTTHFNWLRQAIAAVVLAFVCITSWADGEPLYTARSKILIPNFTTDESFTTVHREDGWQYIRFARSLVPVWVRESFIERTATGVVIKVDAIDAKLQPSLTSPVLTRLDKGYLSVADQVKDGFVRIRAPQPLVVAKRITEAVSKPAPAVSATSRDEQNTPVQSASREVAESASTEPTEQSSQAPIVTQKQLIRPSRTVAPTSIGQTQHRIAPGDSISLIVFGESDLSRENLRVAENGQVSFPLIGSIDAAGLTTGEVEIKVQARLAQGYVRDPKVSVSMYSYRPIFIRGAVRNTGVFDYSQGLTISKVLALAGGVSANAKPSGVSIERDGVVFIQGLDFDSQQSVESGDVISVAGGNGDTTASGPFIYLHGEVNQPGEYQFRSGLTVEKAIVLAGGFSMRASKSKITVTRYVSGQEKPETIKKAELYMTIEPGDVIKVGASFF